MTFFNLLTLGITLLMLASCNSNSDSNPVQSEPADGTIAEDPQPVAPSGEVDINNPTDPANGPTADIAGLWNITYTGDDEIGLVFFRGDRYMLINSNGPAAIYEIISNPDPVPRNCFTVLSWTVDVQGNDRYLFTPLNNVNPVPPNPELYRIVPGAFGLELTRILEPNINIGQTETIEFSWTAPALVGIDPMDIPICDDTEF